MIIDRNNNTQHYLLKYIGYNSTPIYIIIRLHLLRFDKIHCELLKTQLPKLTIKQIYENGFSNSANRNFNVDFSYLKIITAIQQLLKFSKSISMTKQLKNEISIDVNAIFGV